jgi:SPP1 family predicted phage head-tail adaptor
MIPASLLKERVRIEQPTMVDDGYGGKTVTWTALATVYAEVKPILSQSSEARHADRIRASASYRVRMRLRTDVTAAMRLIWKTHVLQIHSLHEQGDLLNLLTYEETL